MQTDQKLPAVFLETMEKLLGDDFPEFLSSYDLPRRNGLRVNRLKVSSEEFCRTAPFPVEPVPWTDNGYFVDYRDMPARHPWYNAGVYYLQEPSAMAPAQILPVQPGDRVLDLCAAPGGKATELGAKLDGWGLLVANEISASRARALLHNIEVFGIRNALVTNESPARLSQRFPGYFDKVLVDAPCSGEGMFRKDPDVVKAWYPEKVNECAAVQREIILQAADMLRPGGYMVYSTCTFAPEENELILLHLLQNREEMELVPIPCEGGRESFRPAYTLHRLQECGFAAQPNDRTDAGFSHEPVAEYSDPDLSMAVRIWPHHCGGEGHFTALLRKKDGNGVPGQTSMTEPLSLRAERKDRKREEAGKASGRKGAAGRKGKERQSQGAAGLSKTELGYVREFLERFLPGMDLDTDLLENHNGRLYLSPEGTAGIRGLTFLRNGLYLGDLKKNRFEPAQELAMALEAGAQGEARISLSPEDARTAQYLHGESIRIDDDRDNGWYLVCVDGYPLGWGKLAGGQLKNKLLLSWRN